MSLAACVGGTAYPISQQWFPTPACRLPIGGIGATAAAVGVTGCGARRMRVGHGTRTVAIGASAAGWHRVATGRSVAPVRELLQHHNKSQDQLSHAEGTSESSHNMQAAVHVKPYAAEMALHCKPDAVTPNGLRQARTCMETPCQLSPHLVSYAVLNLLHHCRSWLDLPLEAEEQPHHLSRVR